MWLSDLTLQTIAFRIVALLVIAGVHGAAVALAAVLLGDKGPSYDGRLSPSPARHLDLLGSLSLILFGIGWSKPMAVDAREFRIGRAGIILVILAGFIAALAVGAVFEALRVPALTSLSDSAALTVGAFLPAATSVAVWFAVLSLIPVPPLTGGMLLGAYGVTVPPRVQWIIALVLVAAVATGLVRRVLQPIHDPLLSLLTGG